MLYTFEENTTIKITQYGAQIVIAKRTIERFHSPIDDDGIAGCFISVTATFLVAASTVSKQRFVIIRT